MPSADWDANSILEGALEDQRKSSLPLTSESDYVPKKSRPSNKRKKFKRRDRRILKRRRAKVDKQILKYPTRAKHIVKGTQKVDIKSKGESNNHETLRNIEFSVEDIKAAMGELPETSAPGPDNFPSILLNKCRTQRVVVEYISSTFLSSFADDTRVGHRVKTVEDLTKFQKDLDSIYRMYLPLKLEGISEADRECTLPQNKNHVWINPCMYEMAAGLSRLKGLAIGLGDEVTDQNTILDRIQGKAEKADHSIEGQNLQIKKLLKK
ncbi:unnamed protein product [Meganyctiphanes norvegica]|uniref:t-SNARE coiled-coil homology domain-containing protein n=1 Tax=Meganyctiphanes norvegica TaxID=48144 RepID=A0AAV2PUF8_MEGNR